MKRPYLILAIYLGILIALSFFKERYFNLIAIVLTVLFFGYMIFEFYKVAKLSIEGDLIVRKQKARIRPLFILLALIPTVGFFITDGTNFLQILLFWSIVIFHVVVSVLTKQLKPIGMVVRGDDLILNGLINAKRDIRELKGLQLNGLTECIEMKFVSERPLLIRRSEYMQTDVERLILICVERSQETVVISDNLQNDIYNK